jgi:hypothetical protein
MNPNRPNPPITWSPEIWKAIDDEVRMKADAIRILKRTFMAANIPSVGDIPVDVIDSNTLEILEVGTRQYVTLSVEFLLEEQELSQEATRGFCRHKAIEAATKIALLEDALFFWSREAVPNQSGLLKVKGSDQLRTGLLENAKDRTQAVTVTIAPDAPGPTQVLTRTADAQVFLIIRYSLSGSSVG